MSAERVLTLTDDNFQQEVLNSTTPVLVDFAADWCPPCRVLEPTIAELAEEYDGRVKVGRVDVDANTLYAGQFGISSIPTIILFRNGRIENTFVGLTSKEEFVQALDGLAA